MKSLSYEFLLQVAIFTLKEDLNLTDEELNRFKKHFQDNVSSIGEEMLKAQLEAKANFSSTKDDKYIEH